MKKIVSLGLSIDRCRQRDDDDDKDDVLFTSDEALFKTVTIPVSNIQSQSDLIFNFVLSWLETPSVHPPAVIVGHVHDYKKKKKKKKILYDDHPKQ